MASLSPLQTLPLHAVEKIVDYFSDNVRLNFDGGFHGPDRGDTYFNLQVPLLWVCHSFRAVVYSRLCRRYKLVFIKDRNSGKALGYRAPAEKCLERLSGPFHLCAKDVVVTVSEWTIYSGEALAALSQVLPDGCSFPSASSLEISFDEDREGEEGFAETADVEANISAFVRWILQTAPRLKWIKVSGYPSWKVMDEPTHSHFDSLISQLVRLTNRVSLQYEATRPPELLNVDSIRMMTYLDVDLHFINENIIRLIRLNAPTLQHLSVSSWAEADISDILQGHDGSYVEYPRLHTLRTGLRKQAEESRQYSLVGAALFPNLRCLVCLCNNPFDNDFAMFRGNADTLEYLQLDLDHRLAAALIREQVFMPTSHPKLQCVMLTSHLSSSFSSSTIEPGFLQLMFDMAPGAAVRSIYRLSFDEPIPRLLSLLGKHAFLQVLSLPDQRLVVWDALTLIKSLPLLSDLRGKAPKLHPMPESLEFDDLVGYVRTTYSPMATRFRCCHIDEAKEDYVADSVVPFLLLALACPNFDYVAVPIDGRAKFAEQLQIIIRKP
ncbi:hypothetical protein IWW39_005972, partial [Coemansia spiralis]